MKKGKNPTLAPNNEESTILMNDLVRKMSRGDESALTQFRNLHRRYSYAIAYRMSGDRDCAEEIVQDALIKLYRNSANFDPTKSSAVTYFNMLLRGIAIDRIRQMQRTKIISYVENPIELASHEGPLFDERSPAGQAEISSQIERLRNAISNLNPSLRKPIQTLYETGETYKRIAETLQVPLGTVKTSIRRAMRILRETLETETATEEIRGEIRRVA